MILCREWFRGCPAEWPRPGQPEPAAVAQNTKTGSGRAAVDVTCPLPASAMFADPTPMFSQTRLTDHSFGGDD
jgi:hypothetical protein